MLSIFFLILLSHACSVKSQLPQNIFILAGQSNMAGRGGVINNTKTNTLVWDGFIPPQCQPNPSILRLDAKLTWVQAHEPLHADIDVKKTNGVGPGMPFANAILTEHPSFGVIGLVPCAIGGTKISEWRKGSFHYEEMVRRTQAALQSGGIIRALLWYQGESDTITLEDAESYKGRLQKFFMDLRSDLQDPRLPIIRVALASGQGPFADIVREAQLESELPNVECVDAKGLQLEPDGLHLTTPSQVQLGEMLADAFLQSIPSPIKTNAVTERVADYRRTYRSPENPLEFIQVEIANVESKFASSISEITVEVRVKEGKPHLTKVGSFGVDVRLEGSLIQCRQVDQPSKIGKVGSLLGEENINVHFMSVGRNAP